MWGKRPCIQQACIFFCGHQQPPAEQFIKIGSYKEKIKMENSSNQTSCHDASCVCFKCKLLKSPTNNGPIKTKPVIDTETLKLTRLKIEEQVDAKEVRIAKIAAENQLKRLNVEAAVFQNKK
jgi:hypothetical protein